MNTYFTVWGEADREHPGRGIEGAVGGKRGICGGGAEREQWGRKRGSSRGGPEREQRGRGVSAFRCCI